MYPKHSGQIKTPRPQSRRTPEEHDGTMYVFDNRNKQEWRGLKRDELPSHILARLGLEPGLYDVVVVPWHDGPVFKRQYKVEHLCPPMKVTPVIS